MDKKFPVLLLWFFLLFSLFSYSQKQNGSQSKEIIILHTNDMHAKIDNMGKLAYLADSLRKCHPYVYLVAAGDNFTGNPVVDMVADKGYPMIDLMNLCGFNASAIGNHEFDLGQEFLNTRMEQARFPFICANIDVSNAILKQPRPYICLDAGNGDSLAFLGLIELNDKGLPDSHPSKLTGLKFSNGIEKAGEFTWLKEKYGILIALSHLGVETDRKLAETVPQFDLIIGGHSHSLIDTLLKVNGVTIVQTGSGMKYAGKITLRISEGHVTSLNEELIPLDSKIKTDPLVQTSIDRYNNNDEFKKVVAVAEKPAEGFDNLGSLYTDALTDQLKVNFAFQNRKGLRIYALNQGDITLKDVYQLDPFQNQVITYTLTGEEISSLICNSFDIDKRIDLAVSGMNYTVVTDSAGRCSSVEMKENSGKLIGSTTSYTVALNDYVSSTYAFIHKDPGIKTGITTEQLIINYLLKLKTINYSGVKRTFVKTAR
jgi:5'-nucleotidase / UDP-sugar diphosphatase